MRTLGLVYLATFIVLCVLSAAGEPENSTRGPVLVVLLLSSGVALSIVAVTP